MKKRRNCCYLQCFCAVRSRNHCKYHGFWGSGGQKHCNLQCVFNQRQKNTGICDVFIHTVTYTSVIYEVFGSFEASRQACRKHKNTVKTSVSALTKRRKSVQKRVQKRKNPPPGQPTCGTAKKDVANQKIEVKKLKNTVFFTFRLPIFDGRVHEQV